MTDHLDQSETSPPERKASAVVALEAKIEEQLWRWDAELDAAGVVVTDKARTLLFYAWQEYRGRDRQRTQAVVMPPTREELLGDG